MSYSTPDDRRQSASRKYQGRAGESRATGQTAGSGTRRVQARGGSSAQYRNSRNRRSKQRGGYALGGRGNLGRRRGGLLSQAMDDPRLAILLLVGAILCVALLVGLFSLVRGCVSKRSQQKASADANSRVSLSVSSDMAARFEEALSLGDQLEQIAQNADKIENERLLELALAEPSAIPFVAGYLDDAVPKSAQAYTDAVSKGYYPKLFNWDARWGYVSYGDGPIALTGSGPTSLAMAYMGLTGKTDQTPDSLAKLATQKEKTDKVYGTSAEFFTESAEELGLEIHEYSASGDTLSEVLESGTVVLVQLRERSITQDAHWALAVSRNLDGSVNLYDPTSSVASEHPWDPDTIAGGADALYSLSLAPEDSGESW